MAGNVSTTEQQRDELEFESHEAAYAFYNEYARTMGFGTAKLSSRRSRSSREFIDAKFSCIRYGNKQQSGDAINPRPSPKIGCRASMHVKRKQNGKWYVYGFVKEHNHELLPAQARFFRSHRDAAAGSKRKAISSPPRPPQISAYSSVDYLEAYLASRLVGGSGGGDDGLVFETEDVRAMLDLFSRMQEENPRFFYAVDFNADCRLRSVFWCVGGATDSGGVFTDVVSFETTYFRNKYRVPLVLFVGVNHHVRPVLLGSALISDDTAHTFLWLMQTWRVSIGGLAPSVILSDESHGIRTAVSAVFPETRHCFCLWHVLEKIPKQLSLLNQWRSDFDDCVFRSGTPEEFDRRWENLIDRFGLRDDDWFRSVYADRAMWAPVFMTGLSFAGLSTPARSESPNSEFDRYFTPECSLSEVMERHAAVTEDAREEEAGANFDAWHETPELRSPSPFEKQMSFIYTREVFEKFQTEVMGASACHLRRNDGGDDPSAVSYSVKDLESGKEFTVVMVLMDNSVSEIRCTCRMFEYEGHLCRHAVVMLQMSGVFRIPAKYILRRWSNLATSRQPIGGSSLDDLPARTRRYNDLCRRAVVLAEEGSLSVESYAIALRAVKDAVKICAGAGDAPAHDVHAGEIHDPRLHF